MSSFWKQLGSLPVRQHPSVSMDATTNFPSPVGKLTIGMNVNSMPLSLVIEDPRIIAIVLTLTVGIVFLIGISLYLSFIMRYRTTMETVDTPQQQDEDELPLAHWTAPNV